MLFNSKACPEEVCTKEPHDRGKCLSKNSLIIETRNGV